MTTPFGTSARHYYAANLPVIPLQERTKRALIQDWTAFCRAMPSLEQRDSWLRNNARGNIGLPLGPASGLCMIDIDVDDPDLIKAIRECLPPSPWERFGKKGMALAFRNPAQIATFRLKNEHGVAVVELLADGTQCVMPGSIHPDTGRPYTANANLWDVLDHIPALPDDVEALLRRAVGLPIASAMKPKSRSVAAGTINEGGRHIRMVSEIGRLRKAGYVGDALLGMARGLNETICSPSLPDGELARIVRDATNDWEGSDGLPFTDAGNGERLVGTFAGDVRWVRESQHWTRWTGSIWAPDQDGGVERLAKAVGAKLANSSGSDEATQKWGWRSQSATSIRSMIHLAKSELGITVSAKEFDTKLDELNTPTGVVNLTTGEMRASDRLDYLTKRTSIGFDPSAECPRWLKFLDEIFDDPDLVAFVQRLCGYIATGLTREHIAVFASGAGRNGKSTFFNAITEALGDYSTNTSTDTFMQRQSGAMTNDLARLNGARLVLANEGNRGQRLDTARMKGMTGGDPITARFLHQEYVTFSPTFTPVIISNHMPEIDANDPAIWERMVIIPFKRSFDKTERDQELPQKLEAERPGILRWIVEGAVEWHKVGLGQPAAIASAVSGYRNDMDTIGAFLADNCILSPTSECAATLLYRDFESYSRDLGVRIPKQMEFGLELTKRGIGTRKSSIVLRTGIALKPTNSFGQAAA